MHACEEVLQAEVDRIRKAFPSLDVSSDVIVADPAVVLVEESKKATILFVGARGLGAVRRLLLGSVSTKAATYAKCPVIVVRGKAGDPNGPIVVGVSPEVGSNEAVEFAFREARLRNKAVRVIQSHAPCANYELLPETAIRAMVALRMDDVVARRGLFEEDRQPPGPSKRPSMFSTSTRLTPCLTPATKPPSSW